ncbi:MAG: hypothetical protein ACREAU_03450 [Nitrosopumilaceae archaeon]
MKLKELTEYFQTNLYEMSYYPSSDTGLLSGTKLWVRTEPGVLPHVKYRIKLIHSQKGSAVFAIWGDNAIQVEGDWEVTGDDLRKIQTLVALTRDHIIKHIDGEEGSRELGNEFFAVKNEVEKA